MSISSESDRFPARVGTDVPSARLRAHRRSRALAAIPSTALALDALLIAVALGLAILGRNAIETGLLPGIRLNGPEINTAAVLIGLLWLVLIGVQGGYSAEVFGAGTDEYRNVLHASVVAAAGVGISCFLLQFPLSRGLFLLAYVIGTPLLLLGRYLLRKALKRARVNGNLLLRVLIVGTRAHVDEIAAVLRRESWLGYHVIGALTPLGTQMTATASGVSVLGNTDRVARQAEAAEADVVFLAGGAVDSSSQVRQIAWDLEDHDVQVVVAPSLTDVSNERVRVRPVGGLPLIHLEKPRALNASRWAKRSFDVIGSMLLLIAFSPVFLFAAYRIRKHDRGPALFRQTRVGRDGTSFACLKFRTMVTNAEELLAELHAAQGHAIGLFKMQDDPRVTPPGKWLRRYSLDELPQLVNVLRGDMSLVGPRPPLPHEVQRYDDVMSRRMRVRPGMTGLWQISGRSDLSWSEAIRLDLYYVDNWSMVQDLTILSRTMGAVLRGRGAY